MTGRTRVPVFAFPVRARPEESASSLGADLSTRLGVYEILTLLGSGGMGEVRMCASSPVVCREGRQAHSTSVGRGDAPGDPRG